MISQLDKKREREPLDLERERRLERWLQQLDLAIRAIINWKSANDATQAFERTTKAREREREFHCYNYQIDHLGLLKYNMRAFRGSFVRSID